MSVGAVMDADALAQVLREEKWSRWRRILTQRCKLTEQEADRVVSYMVWRERQADGALQAWDEGRDE